MTLQDAIRYFTEETHIMPCMSVACGTAGTCISALGGMADGRHTPLNGDMLFDLASLTKLFTGLMVMRLHEEGRLDLSQPVTRYAPQFTHLTETSVDKVLGFEVALTTPERVDTQKTPGDGYRQLCDIRPGEVTGRAYSDMHAMVLRHVIEGAAQEAYMHEISRTILTPLGMQDTFQVVPEERRAACVSCDGEHRIERGRYILRQGIAPGTPHDPKARLLWPESSGHAGLFATMGDMVRLCQGLLKGDVVSRSTLVEMSRNRTGCRRPDGTYSQYLGAQCYVKHPQQYFSEIPLYESDKAIGLSGFTGHHLSVDVETGVFVVFLGSRVQNRLTVLLPEPGRTLADYGLNPDGTGCITWPDGSRVWSSVDYVHHKDVHLHQAVASVMGLPQWRKPGTAWP
ncbi:MAG: beta-lactamase family protein [Clostridia bacterium]|nr:beta-lactamase family protein [Clostridia bacterium]